MRKHPRTGFLLPNVLIKRHTAHASVLLYFPKEACLIIHHFLSRMDRLLHMDIIISFFLYFMFVCIKTTSHQVSTDITDQIKTMQSAGNQT